MDNHLTQLENADENVLLHKHFQVTFEIDADFLDIPIPSDDQSYTRWLRDQLISDEDLLTKFLLCRALNTLDLDLIDLLAKSGFHDSSGTEIVESIARSLPTQAVNQLLDLYVDGMDFTEEVSGETSRYTYSSLHFVDVTRGKETLINEMPEPFFAIKDFQRCLLAKNQSEWSAVMRVQINYFTSTEIEESIGKALENIDKICKQVEGSNLPLNKIDIGISAAEETDYEAARARIGEYIQKKLPAVEANFWLRRKNKIKPINLMDIMHLNGH
jgi:hypothetical protein